MSLSSDAYFFSAMAPIYAKTKSVIQSRAKIAFAEFVRPDGYWPQPYSLEQTFNVYSWFIKTAYPFTKDGGYNPLDLMIGGGISGSYGLHYHAIRSLDNLRQLFHRAILGRSNSHKSDQWRNENRIAFGAERHITFRHYKPFIGAPICGVTVSEAGIKWLLEHYFSANGDLIVQLNEVHASAVNICGLTINVNPPSGQFIFGLEYGYEGSVWYERLAVSINDELFLDAFSRALVRFKEVSGQDLLENLPRQMRFDS